MQEFPEAHNKVQVSTSGGSEAVSGARDGKELFYRSGSSMMAVPVQIDADLLSRQSVGSSRRLASLIARSHYRPSADGQRFLVLAPLGPEADKPASVVLNWTAALPK